MSLRGFPPCPVALGRIYALDLEDYQFVCLCVCVANKKVYVDTEPEATGQRVITHKHALSHVTKKTHSHTNTPNQLLFPLIHFLFYTIPTIFFTPLNTSAITHSSYTSESTECTSPPGSFSSFCSSFPSFTAETLSVAP